MLAPAQLMVHPNGEIPLKVKLIKREREQASLPDFETTQLEWSLRAGSLPSKFLLYDFADLAAVGVLAGELSLSGFHHSAHILH